MAALSEDVKIYIVTALAEILGCRESTVRNHLFNARKVMQAQLQKRYPEYAQLWRER